MRTLFICTAKASCSSEVAESARVQYKRPDVAVMAACCQGVTFLLLYMGMYVLQYDSLEEVDALSRTDWTFRVLGFSSIDALVIFSAQRETDDGNDLRWPARIEW